MKYDEFINGVQERGHLGSREEAEAAAGSTLQTLAERLAGGEPHDLASQLPSGLAEHVRYDGEQESDPFSLEEFYRRVADKEGTGESEATQHAQVVMGVLRDAVTAGEIEDVRSQLPSGYVELFEGRGSTQG